MYSIMAAMAVLNRIASVSSPTRLSRVCRALLTCSEVGASVTRSCRPSSSHSRRHVRVRNL